MRWKWLGERVLLICSPLELGKYKYGSRYLAIDYSSQPKTETVEIYG